MSYRNRVAVLLLATAAFLATAGAAPPLSRLKDLPIEEARKILLAEGWLPRPTFEEMNVEDSGDVFVSSFWAGTGKLRNSGLPEVQTCTGTGSNPCIFNYRRGDACLRLHTLGEQPYVFSTDRNCPDPAILKVPSHPSVLNLDLGDAKVLLALAGWHPGGTEGRREDGALVQIYIPGKPAGGADLERCTAFGVPECLFRFYRGEECQVVTTEGKWSPGATPYVIDQTRGCPPPVGH